MEAYSVKYSKLHPYFEYATPIINCTTSGTLCKDCGHLVQCVEEGDGFTEIPLETCDTKNGEYCYNDQQCSKEFNPACSPSLKFKCTASGVFPDPVNCKAYHYCVSKDDSDHNYVQTDRVCTDDYGYDMVTTYCDKKLTNKKCPTDPLPCPKCTNVGQSGPLENKSIWYICIRDNNNVLVPELHLCPNGKIYDAKLKKCVDRTP